MAVNVLGGSLQFDAVINLQSFNEQLTQAGQSVSAFLQKQQQQQQASNRAQAEYASLIQQSGQAFARLGGDIQDQITRLEGLQRELRNVKQAQSELSANKQLGVVGVDEAARSLQLLVQQENALGASIAELSRDMQANDAVMRASSGLIADKTLLLQALKQQYASLSDVDKAGAGIGGKLLSEITEIEGGLRTISADFQTVQQSATAAIQGKVQLLADLKNQYAELSDIDKRGDIGGQMLRNITALDGEVKILNTSFVAIQQNAVGALSAKLTEITNLKDQYQALSDVDKGNDNVGGAMLANIRALESEVTRLAAQFAQIGTASTDTLNEKIEQITRLKNAFAGLSEVERIDPSIGGNLLAQIKQLETDVDNIAEGFKAIADNAFGSINEKTALLTKLKNDYAALSAIDRDADIGRNMVANINAIEGELKTINTAFQAVASNAAGSINEKVQLLAKLKEDYAALSEVDRNNANIGGTLLTNIQRIDAEVQELNKSFAAIAQNAEGSLNQKTATLSALRAEYAALSEADRNADIGSRLAENIRGLDEEIRQIGTAFSQASRFAAGSIAEKTQELTRLKTQYAELSAIDRNSSIGAGMLRNIQQLEVEVRDLNNAFTAIGQNAAGSLNEKIAQVQKLKNEYAALSAAQRNTDVGKNLANNIKGLDRDIANINKQFGQTESFASKAALAIGSYLSFTAATNFVRDIARVRGEFQQLGVAFETMLGSKEKANKLMADVTTFAAKTPFELRDVADATKKLLAFGIAADDIKGTLKSLGDISAGVGVPIQELADIYGKARTQGRLFAEDINQLTGRGIPIIQELAKQFHTTEDQVRGLVEAGKIGFPELQTAFQSLTAEGGKFGGLMEASSKTLTGQISNLQDAYTKMLNDIGNSSEGLFSNAIEGATSLVENYQNVIDIIEVLVATYGSYKAAVITSNAVTAISTTLTQGYTIAETLRYNAMLLSERAMKILNATMLSNPYVAVATGLAALVTSLYLLSQQAFKTKSAIELLNEAQAQGNEELAKQEVEVKNYVSTLQNQNVAESVRLEAYNKLKAISPDIIGSLTFQEAKTTDLTTATNTYIASLRQRIEMERKQSAYAKALQQEEDAFQKAKGFLGPDGKPKKGAGFFGGETFTADFKTGEIESEAKQAQRVYKEAVAARIGVETDLQNSIGKTSDAVKQQIAILEQRKNALGTDPVTRQSKAYKELEDQINSLNASITKVKTTVATPTNKSLIDSAASLEALEVVRKKIEDTYKTTDEKATDSHGKSLKMQLAADLKYADDRKKALDPYSQQKQDTKDGNNALKEQEGLESRINTLLKDRTDVLRSIDDLKRGATQSGLIKEQSELDKVNEKYDNALLKITDFNKKVEEFNKKNKTTVATIGLAQVNELNDSRTKELYNVNLKQQTELYIKNLQDQKAIFEQYEQAKKEIGIEQATEMFQKQTQGYKSHLDFLGAEFKKVLPAVILGVADIGQVTKYKALGKAIQDENKKIAADQQKQLIDILNSTQSFTKKRILIDEDYTAKYKVLSLIRADIGEDEYDRRLQALQQNQQDEYNALQAGLIRQSGLYKKLNADLITASRDDLKKRIADLKKALKDGVFTDADGKQTDVTPQVSNEIESALATAEDMVKRTNKVLGMTGKELDDIAKKTQAIGGIFSGLASAVAPLNQELANTLQQMSDVTNIASSGFAAAASFAAGDMVGAATNAANAIQGIITMFAKAKKSAEDAKKAVRDFYTGVYTGGLDYLATERERLRMAVLINKTKMQGLRDEKKLLDEQNEQVKKQYNDVLAAIQKESFVAGETTKKKHGSIFTGLVGYFFGGTTEVQQQLQSLAGKTYEQLEKLFVSGQLTDKAAELFQQLQKLKEEGVDIDRQLLELQQETREALTGTTADAITDMIVDGFANGKRAVQDFGDDIKSIIQKALLQALRYQALEAPIQKIFEQFALDAESGGGLDQTELDNFTNRINQTIEDAAKLAQVLETQAGVSLSNAQTNGAGANSLQGAIKGITEQQAELLAGQFGGQRLATLELVELNKISVSHLNAITVNTANTVERLDRMLFTLRTEGIKIA